ncbi:MAG: tetratricopeptide repeat protein [Alphaproteobacteria bacterium]|nr:tetratricopeptide repeat protein [Alphaproteobacteria bacterium]
MTLHRALPTDSFGLAVTAASDAAASALDHTIAGYWEFAPDTGDRLKAALTADPEMPMGHVLKGYFYMLMANGALYSRLPKLLRQAGTLCDKAGTPRERAHAAALDAWVAGDFPNATRIWEDILVDHPRDVLALRLHHGLAFYMGRPDRMLAQIDRVMPAFGEEETAYGQILGMRAFALEEAGRFKEAERAGRRAVARNPRDAWAVHAVAHVLEMEDRSREGVEWVMSLENEWDRVNNFRYHLWWHRMLFHWELGEHDAVLDLYDNRLWDPESEEYLDLCNDAAILLRLELRGIEVGQERWRAVAEKTKPHLEDNLLAFVDAHYAVARSAVGDLEGAEHLARRMETLGETRGQSWNADLMAEIGAPLARAIADHRAGRAGEAVDKLLAIRPRLYEIGGSHAQRDLFDLVLIDAAMQAERWPLTRALLWQRQAARPRNAWTHDAAAIIEAKLG